MAYTNPFVVDTKFMELGMYPAGQLPNLRSMTTSMLPQLPSRQEMLEQLMAQQQGPPQALEKHGPVEQFMWGLTSPLTDTLARLGQIDSMPKPVGVGEIIAHTAGGLLGWLGLSAVTGGIAGALGLGTSFAGAAVAPLAARATSAVAKSAIKTIGTSAILGAAYGAHQAWVQEEPLGPHMLQSIAISTALGGLGFGVEQLANKFKIKNPTTQSLLQDYIKRKPVLSVQDAVTRAEAGTLGAILDKAHPQKLESAVLKSTQLARESMSSLPSAVGPGSVGAKLGPKFNTLPPAEQAEAILTAFQNSPQRDVIFEPIIDIARAVKSPGAILKGKATWEKAAVREVVRKGEPALFDISPDVAKQLTKGQQGQLAGLSQAKTLGEQMEIFDKLRGSIRRRNSRMLSTLGVGDFSELVKLDRPDVGKYIKRYTAGVETVQDLAWATSNQISKIAHAHPAINLPDIRAIADPKMSKVYLDQLKIKSDEVDRLINWHPDIQEIIKKWSDQTGKSYTDTTFMPPAMQQEVAEAAKRIKAAGGSPRTFFHGMIAFPVQEDLAAKDLPAFLKALKELPSGSIYSPLSIYDSALLRTEMFRPMPILGRFLTPIRHALGEGFTNQARMAVAKHQKFIDLHGAKQIKVWADMVGLKPGKELAEFAHRAGDLLEGRVPEAMSTRFTQIGESLAALDRKPTTSALISMSKDTGLASSDLEYVWRVLNKIKSDPDKLSSFNAYAKATGVTLDRYAAQHLLTVKLRRAGALTGKAAQNAAEELGLKSIEELKVVFQMRTKFDWLFRESGLDPDMYIPGYLPRFREADGQSYEQIVAMFKGKGLAEKDIKGYLWMNEMSRQAKGIGYRYEQDAFRAYSRYVTGFSKSKNFGDDFFEPWVKHFSELGWTDKSQRMALLRDLRHWMVGRPGEVEKQMDAMINNMLGTLNKSGWNKAWGHRPTAELSSLLTELQIVGGLGFNPFSAVKNLTQKALALTSITDDGNPLHGLKYMAKAQLEKRTAAGKFKLANCPVLDNRLFHEMLEMQQGAMARLAQNLGAPEGAVNTVAWLKDKSMAMFKHADLSNVEDTWLARLLYLTEAKNAPWQDAINLATKTTMATQFMYGFDSPWMYKTPMGRLAGIFMSWPINWAFLLYEQGASGDIRRAVSTAVTMAVGAEMLTLTGMNFMSIHPVNTARGIWPIAMLEGEDSWPVSMRSAASIYQAGRALLQGDPEAIDAAIDNMKNKLRPMVPAGVVGFRLLDFMDLVKNDWRKYDRRGRLKYEATPGEVARGVFGPTTEAYKRVQDWKQVSKMDGAYRHTRKLAIEAFMNQDYVRFQKLQEQLLINFGKWIEPKDIHYEMQLRDMTARERQLISLPNQLSKPYLAAHGR